MANVHPFKSDEELRDEACVWIGRLKSHNVSIEDNTRFEEWRAAHPRHADAYAKVAMVWQQMAATGTLVNLDTFEVNLPTWKDERIGCGAAFEVATTTVLASTWLWHRRSVAQRG